MEKNVFKKLIGRKSTGIIVTILAFVIVFGAIFSISNLTLAKDTLPGIGDIRDYIAGENNDYKVLEIVPTLESAQFGFLVGGEEPFDATTLYDQTTKNWMTWQEYLASTIDTMPSNEREDYMNDLAAKNHAYITMDPTDLTKPVLYKTYTENGVTADNCDGVIQGGSVPVKGYLAAATTPGSGWNTKFFQVEGESHDTYLNDTEEYYYIVSGTVQLSEDIVNADTYPEHFYLYEQHLTGSFYVPSMTFGELKTGIANNTIVAADISKYYVLTFKVLENGDYNADEGRLPEVYKASVADFQYVYSGAAYTITANASKGHELTEPADNVYYQGGFYSNELFKRFTLDIDDADVANYKVDVQTVTAGELNAMSAEELTTYLATVDFIYLNAGINNGSVVSYVPGNTDRDLDAEAVKLIFEKICNEKTPCIVDYYIKDLAASDLNVSNTNAYALACLLMQRDYRSQLTNGKFEKDIASNLNSWAGSVLTTNDSNYVNGNVMVIHSNKLSNPTVLLTDKFYGEAFDSTVIETAYKAVLNEIELENLYRASDQAAGYAPLDTTIYKSTVVRYIMNYALARTIQVKTSIEVLEIQPANVKYPDNSSQSGVVGGDKELTPSRVRTWMGVGSDVTVNITTMNTMEYVGTIEDINSNYDLIYIGADIYSLPNNGSTTNYYEVGNEGLTHPKYTTSTYPSMDKLIYSNVGGLVPVNGQFAGHLAIDWKTTGTQVYNYVMARYNGNDITADKHNELVDYVKGTYTVVVADKLCKSTTEPEKTYVDNCSYLYSFLKEHLKDANVFKASEVENGSNATFQFYTNRAKLDIGEKVTGNEESNVKGGTAFVQPGYYKATDDTTNGHMTYINKETDGKYYLTYKFTITNNGAVSANTKYKAALYIDSNSDGKFSLEFEDIPDITITNVATGAVVTNGQLVAGEQYSLVKEIPNAYNVVTWKVEVSQADNKFIRDSRTGYTRLSDRQKVTLKILQIRRDGGSPLVLETAIGNGKGKGSNKTLNALVYGGYCEADKQTYKGIANEYDFQFKTMTNAAFNTAYANGTLNLMSYDMVILGFYDSYNLRGGTETDINYNSVMGKGGLREYIDSGKSVLFAHDTTSITAVEDYKKVTVAGKNGGKIYDASGVSCSVWGYYLNIYVRDMVGLDTYGITLGKLGKKDGIDYSMVSSGQDLSTSTEGKKLMAALENKLDADGYYKIGLKPLAYVPNSNKTKTVRETQGFLYGWMDWHWKKASNVTYRKVRTKYNTDRAERVNEGQITTYPYYLDETIDIARTHHQYFTLDLTTDDDKDGETDLVVWYTMGGKEGDNSHIDTSLFTSNPNNGFSTKDANFDDTSEKDVMNNYYIYNKGNITYTGFGDFDNTTWLNRGNVVDECKLFINTLVAAYQAGASDSTVSVYDTPDGTVPTDSFFEYSDADNDIAFRTESQRMYFNITDKNVIRGEKKAWAKYYVALKPGTVGANATSYNGYAVETIEDKQCIDVSRHLITYDLAGNKIDTAVPADIEKNKPGLDCDTMYYVDIPTTGTDSIFNLPGVDGQNTNTFFMKTKVILRQTGSLTDAVYIRPSTETIKKVEFTQLELFPLD